MLARMADSVWLGWVVMGYTLFSSSLSSELAGGGNPSEAKIATFIMKSCNMLLSFLSPPFPDL